MSDMQLLMDNLSKGWAAERSKDQLTLGEMIAYLGNIDPKMPVAGISSEVDSYRGYYSDLAFEPGNTTVGELINSARDSLGKEFAGYKGGEYIMSKTTPLFIAHYSMCGPKLMGLECNDDGLFVVTEEEDES